MGRRRSIHDIQTSGGRPSTAFKAAVMEETEGMTPYNVKQHNIGERYKRRPHFIKPSMTRIKARGGY